VRQIFFAGSHCAKGAAVRDDVLSERRLRYPVKLVDGRWTRPSWDQAIDEIGVKLLEIRQKSGPDSVYWLGSAKFTNEAAYLYAYRAVVVYDAAAHCLKTDAPGVKTGLGD
jgi:anaerobic selenocysteine-containing dehydrogenase